MNFMAFLRRLIKALFPKETRPIKQQIRISSKYLKRKVEVRFYQSPNTAEKALRLLIINDGQDLPRMNFEDIFADYNRRFPNQPILVAGLVAGDRLREYGTAGKPDYKRRGDLAYAQEQFIIKELMPQLENDFELRKEAKYRAFAGFSLGGLNAFDIVWRNADVFSTVGVFSGALWWRSAPFDPAKPDADRIVHTYVEAATVVPNKFRCWLMAGTEDERSDRNNNGIIDAIDDTIQLQALLKERGLAASDRLTYLEVEGGKHEPDTWGKVMPDFLDWWISKA